MSGPISSKLLAALGVVLVLQALVLLVGMGLTSFGVTFPLCLGVLLLVWVVQRVRIQAWVEAKRWRRLLWRVLLWGLVLWLVSLLALFVALSRTGTSPDAVQAPLSAIIVLGSGTPNGKPSPALVARLDAAHEVAKRFPQAVVVVSGGVDLGETLSEGRVMGDYLRSQGLPAIRIVQEEASTSTDLNLKLTQPLLAARGVQLGDPVAVVTSDFHVWRAARIAQRQGWQQVQTVGAPMPLYLRYNAWLREYFAIASSLMLGEM